MHGNHNSDELKALVRILNDILSKARQCRPELSTDDIVQRVFMHADRGERDAVTLHDAVFGSSMPAEGENVHAFCGAKSRNCTPEIARLQAVARENTEHRKSVA